MKKTPKHPRFEQGDYNGNVCDPQMDFSKFLEEARQYANEEIFQGPSPYLKEAGNRRLGEEKKSKKSWKNTLFSWWKSDKKSKPPQSDSAYTSHNSKPKRVHVSGPIYGSGRKIDSSSNKERRPTSGPITNFFNSMNGSDDDNNEMSYMCLAKLNNSHGVKTYGPVYLVT